MNEKQPSAAVRTTTVRLAGVDCPDCAAKLEQGLAALPGVHKASLQFTTSKLTVEHSVPWEEVEALVKASGYTVVRPGTAPAAEARGHRWALAAASFFLAGLGLSWLAQPGAAGACFLLAIVLGGWRVARAAAASLRTGRLDMNVLMSAAVTGALAIGEWSEGAAVVVLFAIGGYLQARSLDRTRASVQALLALAPQEAWLLQDGAPPRRVPLREVQPGSLLLVRPGERIPLDGRVRRGSGAVDEAVLTGESMPVDKQAGDTVYGGSLNQNASLEIEVTHGETDSTVSRIAQLVEEAQERKLPLEQWVDRFARYYTPAVLGGAALSLLVPWLLWGQPLATGFYRTLVLLVIACPCALVISTPVSVVAALGSASRQGILIKSGQVLEQMARIRQLAFDKTGTLTVGHPSVSHVEADVPPEELLRLAAALERHSTHPLAKAVLAAAGEDIPAAAHVREEPGHGLRGRVGGSDICVGTLEFCRAAGRWQARARQLEQEGDTVIAVTRAGQVLGLICLNDQLRPEAAAALARLRRQGIAGLWLLTGDNERTAAALSRQLQLDGHRSRLLPLEKAAALQELMDRRGPVAMVGDGINDAPALATASLGIAVGSGASSAALETADVALLHSDLQLLPQLVALSRRMLSIVHQNIAFALLTKLFFLALTAAGWTQLWLAVLADSGAALAVTLNSMRLLQKQE